jgi:hypothetical protein
MKAIVTKYHGATNFRGARISATAEGVGRIYVSYPHKLSGEDVHRLAAETLCKKYGWELPLVGGGLPDLTGYAFCFIPKS